MIFRNHPFWTGYARIAGLRASDLTFYEPGDSLVGLHDMRMNPIILEGQTQVGVPPEISKKLVDDC